MEYQKTCKCGGSIALKMIGDIETLFCNKCSTVIGYSTNKEVTKIYNNNDIINFDKSKEMAKFLTIYNEGCELTMSRMVDNLVDYTITSPPYNIAKDGEKKYSDKKAETNKKYAIYKDDLRENSYYLWQVRVINSLLRVTKYHVFYVVQMLTDNKIELLSIMDTFRDKIKDIIIWKKNPVPPHIQEGILNSAYEFIIVFSNDNPKSRKFSNVNFGQGKLANIIETKVEVKKYAEYNRATYPVNLIRWIIMNFCKPTEIIYDPFMGTGTTAVACKKHQLGYIGSEIDPNQVELANKRIYETADAELF